MGKAWCEHQRTRHSPNSQDNADRHQQQPNVKPDDPDAELRMRLDPVRVASGEGCNSDQGDQEIPRSSMHGIKSRCFDAVGWSEMVSERPRERLNDLGTGQHILQMGKDGQRTIHDSVTSPSFPCKLWKCGAWCLTLL